jgi:two-component system chemotaxis response regulator CheB
MLNVHRLRRDIVVIGASAGGVEALTELFRRLPADLPAAVAVVLHLSPTYPSRLPALLARVSRLRILPATDHAALEQGCAYVSVPDQHLVLSDHAVRLTREPKEHFSRPAVDPLFRSAARLYGPRVVGVLLSGSGSDGVIGSNAIKAAGGMVLVEEPSEAAHASMPLAAIARDGVDAVLSLERLANTLPRLAIGEAPE